MRIGAWIIAEPGRARQAASRRSPYTPALLEPDFRLLIPCDGAMSDQATDRWPRDLKLFALLCALWAAGLIARLLIDDTMDLSGVPLESVIGGMKFYSSGARAVTLVQAAVFFAVAIGIAWERKYGLALALLYLAQAVMSHLIFMLAYMDDLTQLSKVKDAAAGGMISVLILLYVWIRSRELLFGAGRLLTHDSDRHSSRRG